MRRHPFLFFLSSVFCLLSSAIFGFTSDDLHRVTRVIDGDTIEVEGGQWVRYIGLDTPELRKKKNGHWIYHPQPYAQEAKALNEKWVGGKKVHLEYDAQRFDRYGRLLAYVYVGDLFVNREMIRKGYARLLNIPPDVQHADDFWEALREAKKHHRGMWR
ncbi:MAG: thermonuclease family protein [Chlamydiae bacterium]|nr:thermonuclease family protein [Chlamydiota bacterium]MBI3266324.1 thermonuclease family protein [Chlamydiota bacterium]